MKDSIQFLEYQKPALVVGDYKIKATQTLKVGNGKSFSSETTFAVVGERFSLDPAAVHAIYPPAGRLGRYSDCLPHISIKRSTFPWERSAYGNEDYEPWLALLLFDEEEVKNGDVTEPKTVTLGELEGGSSSPEFPGVELETGQSPEDKVTVIDVKKRLLDMLIPTGNELKLLTHVRRRVGENENAPEIELAVVMANRLPREGSGSIMHLVSLEGRCNTDGTFNSATTNDDDLVRLVSLKNWGFASILDQGKNFEELVEEIDTGILRLPTPVGGASVADAYLSKGYVPLPHTLRQSDKTYSWYHSPLGTHAITAEFTSDNDLPDFGDALVRYHQDIGMFDVSYAAAFELGRTLALEDTLFSAALYQWKQQYNEQRALELQRMEVDRLVATAGNSGQDQEDALKTRIRAWLGQLAKLHNVPFNYLVPDERMLPPESIRFFKIDNHWIESLLYGAFTIGGPIREGDPSEIDLFKQFVEGAFAAPRSGFIVRSELVADYPDLQVDAYSAKVEGASALTEAEKQSQLDELRIEQIGYDTLLCLFQGDAGTAELYLKPEGLRFGLDEEEADNGTGMKYEKDIEIEDFVTPVELADPFKDADKRILKIKTPENDGIADRIRDALILTDIDPAQFGMHMIEGSNKGRFVESGQ